LLQTITDNNVKELAVITNIVEANTVACILYTNLLTVHRSRISPVSEMKVKVVLVEAAHEPDHERKWVILLLC